MKSYRNIGLILFALASLSACTHDNKEIYDPDMVICFQPAIGVITKTDDSKFPVDSDFSVWAFSLDVNKNWNSESASAKDWLIDERITFNGLSWATADKKFWNAKDQSLTFFAYAPSSLPMSYESSKGMCLKGFDVRTDDSDILFTDVVPDINKMNCNGTAALPFRHALSKVGFRIESAGTYGAELHIKSIKIDGISPSGDFHSIPAGWDLSTEKTELELCKEEFILSYDTKDLGSWIVLPQDGKRNLVITYDLYKDGEKFLVDQHLYAKPIETVWAVGKQYVYTLIMSLDDISYKTDILDRL